MTTATATLLEKIYKIKFSKGITTYLAENSNLIAWTPMDEDSFGAWKWWKTYRTNAVRGSTKFGTANANRSVPSYQRAEITRSQDHVVVSVECEAARASASDEYALVNELEDAVTQSSEELALSIENLLTGDGGGSRGQIATSGGISGSTITLEDASKIYLFQEGMKIQLSNDTGTGTGHALRSAGATLEIATINQAAGSFTTTVAVTTGIADAANGDYIFREGDFDQGAKRVLQGYFAWCPATAPTSGDNHFGLTRDTNVGALAGQRVNGGGNNPYDTVKEAAALVRRNRGKCDTLWVNPTKFAELDLFVQAKQFFTQETQHPDIGVKGMRIATPAGYISVMENPAWAEGVGLLTSRDSWLLRSLGKFPHPVDDDGQMWHLEETSDSMQMRHRYYAQLGCMRPQDSCHITF